MSYGAICDQAEVLGLTVMGALHPDEVAAKGVTGGTLILLGTGTSFWPIFQRSAEAGDGARNSIDRWSERVIGEMAEQAGAHAIFPFGGPPYAPFIDWALKSGRAFQSPTGMLVHDEAGLMISYRGALHFDQNLPFPRPHPVSPCDDCADRPCTTACPVGALSGARPYDVAVCHAFLDTSPGQDCMGRGCAARRACPVSQKHGRDPAQSALHMKAFHPT